MNTDRNSRPSGEKALELRLSPLGLSGDLRQTQALTLGDLRHFAKAGFLPLGPRSVASITFRADGDAEVGLHSGEVFLLRSPREAISHFETSPRVLRAKRLYFSDAQIVE